MVIRFLILAVHSGALPAPNSTECPAAIEEIRAIDWGAYFGGCAQLRVADALKALCSPTFVEEQRFVCNTCTGVSGPIECVVYKGWNIDCNALTCDLIVSTIEKTVDSCCQ